MLYTTIVSNCCPLQISFFMELGFHLCPKDSQHCRMLTAKNSSACLVSPSVPDEEQTLAWNIVLYSRSKICFPLPNELKKKKVWKGAYYKSLCNLIEQFTVKILSTDFDTRHFKFASLFLSVSIDPSDALVKLPRPL